jgi:phosphoesterase RecJ-like protein
MRAAADPAAPDRIRAEIAARQRFLITSHAQPDGDSIGSQLALAFALQALGKTVRVVNRDPAPPAYFAFPGVDGIEIAERVEGDFDALFVMECPNLARTGVANLERYFAINIDHHAGNEQYGAVNWFDETAAACGEMVFDLVDGLGSPLDRRVATHISLAILTDTGSFHHSNMTARTFEICRRVVETGVDPAAVAGLVYDSASVGKLKLTGALLHAMTFEAGGHIAVLYLDDEMLRASGSAPNDTEGIVNLPLSAREVHVVVFFKPQADGRVRVSLRSKGDIDVRAIAARYGGGGHKNASGFTVEGDLAILRSAVLDHVTRALHRPDETRATP